MMLEDFKIQWFPGHMTKAKRMMESQIKLVDVVVEMLDARIPRSSTNPMLQDILGSKPKVIALNKIDMADKAQTDVWLEKIKHSGLPVCKIDCATGKGVKQLISAVQLAAKPVIDKWLKKGVRNRPVRVMIVGIPNVGKSTLINRLVGKNKVMAADKPGVTRGQQWVTIAKGLELLDTPGVLWPKFDDPSVGFALAVTGAIKEDVFDREQAVELLLDLLIRKYPQDLQNKYAAAAQQGGAVVSALPHDLGEFRRSLGIDSNSVVPDGGNTGVGLADQRDFHTAPQLGDKIGGHHIRCHAVKAHRRSAGILQGFQGLSRVRAGQQGAVGLHGKAVHGSPRALQFSGAEDGFRLLLVQQRLADEKIRPAINETANLAAVVLHQQIKGLGVPAVAEGG